MDNIRPTPGEIRSTFGSQEALILQAERDRIEGRLDVLGTDSRWEDPKHHEALRDEESELRDRLKVISRAMRVKQKKYGDILSSMGKKDSPEEDRPAA